MPNIEIHGFSCNVITHDREIRELRAKIINEILKFEPNIVITIVFDETVGKSLIPAPFIRIVFEPDDKIGEIVDKLRVLKLDIEVMALTRFISKNKIP